MTITAEEIIRKIRETPSLLEELVESILRYPKLVEKILRHPKAAKIIEEIQRRREATLLEEIRKLRQDFNRMLEGQERLLERQDRLSEEFQHLLKRQDQLQENFNELLMEVRELREGQERLWRSHEELREGQERLWRALIDGFNSMRRFAGVSFEEFVRDWISRELRRRGVMPKDASLTSVDLDGEEVDLFFEEPLIVGEVTSFAETDGEVDKLLRKAAKAERKYRKKPKLLYLVILTVSRSAAGEIKRKAKEQGIELIMGKEVD